MNPEVEVFARYLLLIAAIAGAVKGIEYLLRKLREGGSRITVWWDERTRKRRALAELADTETWPNGSTTLTGTIVNLYGAAEKTHEEIQIVRQMVADMSKSIENVIVDGTIQVMKAESVEGE